MYKILEPKIDKKSLINRLHLREEQQEEFNLMLEEALKTALPKAVFKSAAVETRGKDFVVIDGIKYRSHILSVNLADVYKVFPYIITAGIELQKWSEKYSEILADYWADSIQEEILRNAASDICNFIDHSYSLGKAADMNPGSLRDWPIEEQQKLLDQFSDIQSKMKIELTQSFLIYPPKSLTGIRFPSQVNFENCQLCPRENCSSRRAEYNPKLFKKRYKDAEKNLQR